MRSQVNMPVTEKDNSLDVIKSGLDIYNATSNIKNGMNNTPKTPNPPIADLPPVSGPAETGESADPMEAFRRRVKELLGVSDEEK